MKRKLLLSVVCCLSFALVFAQNEQEISLEREGGKLFGTLSEPSSAKATHVVLMISGSGPTDRDGNSAMGLKTNKFKMMAEALAAEGIASLRYDKRMIGKSQFAGYTEADMTFDDMADDAAAWVKFLKGKYEKVIIAGHSEGALVGTVAFQKEAADAVIHISGAGKSADKLIYDQLYKQMPALADTAKLIMDKVIAGDFDVKINPMLMQLFRPSVMPYLQSWFRHDPAQLLGQIEVPTMIIQGDTDLQVDVSHATKLAEIQPKAELVVIKDMNHVLKKSSADPFENMSTYNNGELALHEDLMPVIINFIKKH